MADLYDRPARRLRFFQGGKSKQFFGFCAVEVAPLLLTHDCAAGMHDLQSPAAEGPMMVQH